MNKLKSTQNICVFKQWSNKAYSIFSSFSKEVKIGVLAVGIVSMWGAKDASAQMVETHTNDTIELEEVDVEFTKPAELDEVGKIVTTLTTAEIQRVPVASLTELLGIIPAIDIRQRGVDDVQADVIIRGGSFDQNMILLNGINISNPQTGHNTLTLPIDLNSLSQVEVVKGAGSKIYGFNAFSGAVNFVAGEYSSPLNVELSAGNYGYLKTSLQSGLQLGDHYKNYLSFDYSQSDGYTTNTDYKIGRFYYQGDVSIGKSNIQLMAGYVDKAFGAQGFYTAKYPNQFEEVSSLLTAAKFKRFSNNLKTDASIYWLKSNDRFELFRDNPASWYTQHNYHQTDVLGADVKLAYYSHLGKTSLRAELRNEAVKSNVLGELLSDTIYDNSLLHTPTKDGFFTHQYSRLITNIALSHTYSTDHFSANASLLALYADDFGLYPGIDLRWMPNEKHELMLSFDQSTRLPTFTDLFYQSSTQKSNPNLNPEVAFTQELGYHYKSALFTASTNIFYRHGKDLIDWAKLEDEEQWQSMNIASLNTWGAEVNGTFLFQNKTPHFWIQSLSVGYCYLDNDNDDQLYNSSSSSDFLKHKLTSNIVFEPLENLLLTAGAYYQNRAGEFEHYEDGVSTGMEAYDSFVTLNGAISYKYKMVTLSATSQNISNTEAYDYGNIILPGRWTKFGIRIEL